MIDFTRYPDNVLPLPLLKNHSLKRNSMLLVTKMASGYPRLRQQFKTPPSDMGAAFLFSNEEFEIFEGWFINILFSGQSWFVMQVKTPGGHIDHECQFVGDYSAKASSDELWKVTAKLKVKNLRVITEDETIGRIHNVDSPTQALRDALNESITEYVRD